MLSQTHFCIVPLWMSEVNWCAHVLWTLSRQVKIWFQNRRMKWRNSKERELLSSGGCREQTLPTKMNPNPDLSDVVKKFGTDASPRESPRAPFCQPRGDHELDVDLHFTSPSISSKHSDFSESEDEEITVS